MTGELYLIHFEPAYRHARHYLGWAKHSAEERFQEHLRGQGSPLVKAALAAGCKVELVKVWPGDRTEERRLKTMNGSLRHCPRCRANTLAKNAERMRQYRRNLGRAA